MSNLQIFENEEFGKVRAIEINNAPWFLAKDLCDCLDIRTDSVRSILEQDEVQEINPNSIGVAGGRNPLIVSESGLYSLVLKSRKEAAKRFKQWVTHDVLPSIRKNGGYIANQENLSDSELLAKAMMVAQKVIENQKIRIAEMQPKAEYFDELVERNLLTNFRDTAKELGIKESEFITFLMNHRYIYRDNHRKIRPYADKNKGLFELKEFTSQHSEHVGIQTLITPKGRETFRLLIKMA